VADALFGMHSGVRYLVLLAGVVALAAAFASLRTGTVNRAGRISYSVFVGLLDVQVLLGIGTLLARAFFPALIGHITMMLLAAVVAHGFAIALKRRPPERRTPVFQLAGVALALVLVVGGILSIGRSLV
jgi:heme A synthase